jgi:hypothetical protein
MIHTIRTKKVAFDFGVEKVKSPVLDLEFEPLDTSNWSPASIKKAERITKRLEEIL